MAKLYRDEFGNPSPLPVGIEEAKRCRTVRYYDRELCPICGGKLFYTKNQNCVTCSRYDASDLYGLSVGLMSFIDLPEEYGTESSTAYESQNHLGPVGNRDVTFEYKAKIEAARSMLGGLAPTSIEQAVRAGAELWVYPEPCKVQGHLGIRTLRNECFFCKQERDKPHPRQEAIRAGESWYSPDKPCLKCGQKALKRVSNGACKGCIEKAQTVTGGTDTPDSIMMKAQPEMVISKEAAGTLGMKVYRTGVPCRRGHKGFRYVSTNSCIDCLRGRG